ncbi:hypothetical protein ACPF8X_03125 [Streptomyces sp. G35A]
MTKKPGAWPVQNPVDLTSAEEPGDDQGAQYVAARREEARRHHLHASIRQHLAEQPTARAVRRVAERYKRDVDHLAASVIAALNSTEIDQ